MKKVIDLYKKIQNIPYCFSLPKGPEYLLKKNKGVCSEKHLFLAKELKKLKVSIKFILVKFNWRESTIPKSIISKRKNPIDWHLALKIKPNKKWIYLDATWDSKLRKTGLPVNEGWDGKSDTKLAVKAINIFEFPFSMYGFLKALSKKRKNKETEFQKAFNKWLEERRA